MLKLLFDPSFFVGIIATVAIFVLIILMIKYPSFRLACFIILGIIYIFVTVYCVVNLNIYYNASGGIFGEVTGLFSPTVSVEESKFNFDNIELVQYLDTDTYYCKISLNQVVEVDDDKDYMVYVNDKPCSNVSVNKDLLSADYRYQFFDENNNLLCDDTLIIRFAFGKNESYIYVATYNGSQSVKFWNYYFNRNNFVVSFKEGNYQKDSEIKYGTGEVPTMYKVDYVYTDDYVVTKFYSENSTLELSNLVGIENWSVDDTVVTEDYVVDSNLTVKANFYDIDEISKNSDISISGIQTGKMLYSPAKYFGLVYYDISLKEYHIVSFTGYGWKVNSHWDSNYYYISSDYAEVKDFIYDVDSLCSYSLDVKMHNHYLYKDNFSSKLLYSMKDTQGYYLYNLSDNSHTQIFEHGKWCSVTSHTDSSVTLYSEFGSFTTKFSYDFRSGELDLNPEKFNDVTYGVYKTADKFQIAYIDDSTKHLYVYDVLANTTKTIQSSNHWEMIWGFYNGEQEIEFLRGYSSSKCYVLNYNFETGKITNSSFDNGTISGN